MTSEAARAKAIQVTAITILIKPLIDKGYENYKLLHLVTFDHKKDSYDQTVKHTNDIVLHTSSGKSQVALSKTLDELIRDSSTITNGINSILVNTKDYSTNFLDTQNKPANMIELLDAFESTKGKLSSTIFKLESLKRLNNSLLPDMTDIYNDVINTLAIRFYLVSRPEIEAIAISQGLLPTDNIELASIDESNTYIDKSIQTVEKTTIDIQTYFNDIHQKDRLVALSFNYSDSVKFDQLGWFKDFKDWLFGKDKDKKKNWTAEYKAREQNKAAVIEQYQTVYGLTYEQAVYLFEVYDKHFAEYADKMGWDEQEGSYQYFMMLASIAYQGTSWSLTAGVLPTDRDEESPYEVSKDSEWYKRMKEMGLSEQEIRTLSNFDTNTRDVQSTNDENGDGLIDDNDKITVNADNDFLHMSASAAVQLNPNALKAIPDTGTFGQADEYSNYKGDVASGSFDFADVRANVDSSNLSRRIKSGNLDPFTAMDGYANDVLNEGVNPAVEYIMFYDVDGDGVYGSLEDYNDYSYDEKLELFRDNVKNIGPLNPGNIWITRGDEETQGEPQRTTWPILITC